MSANARGYFDNLKDWLNTDHYAVFGHPELHSVTGAPLKKGTIILSEEGKTVTLGYKGDAFAVHLDKNDKKDGGRKNLFHFLNNTGHWTKRCDFVVFHLHGQKINVYCIEFKSDKIDQNQISGQLNAGRDWVCSLRSTLLHYVSDSRRLYLSRFVFVSTPNPNPKINPATGRLTHDSKVRLWKYKDVNGKSLHDLDNKCVEIIR